MVRLSKLTFAERPKLDRKSTRLNSSHTVIYTLSLHDALPILYSLSHWNRPLRSFGLSVRIKDGSPLEANICGKTKARSEEHTSELQSHSDLHSFPTRRSSDLIQPQSLESSASQLWSFRKD